MAAGRRKVLFVALDADEDKYTYMSLAAGSLLTTLSSRGGGEIEYWSPPSQEVGAEYADQHAERILARTRDMAPEGVDILFGVYVWNEPLIRQVLPLLREPESKNRIVLGGPQITAAPAGTLEGLYPQADVFVRGEAEDVLAEVSSTVDRVDVPGVHYAGAGDDGSQAEADLCALPSPYLHHTRFIPFKRVGRARWETKRGCPYACRYCQHRGTRRQVRGYKRKRLFDEMSLFSDKGVNTLTVLDPIFNVGAVYIDIVAELVRLGFAGRLSVQCRFEMVTDEFLELVRQLDVCLEFGLQTIHTEECRAIGRKNRIDKVGRVMHRLGKLAIDYKVDLMYGLPAQTPKSFRRSLAFCREHGARKIDAWPLMLLRGTEIAKAEFRNQWRLKESDDAVPIVTSSSTFSRTEWEEMKAMADELKGRED